MLLGRNGRTFNYSGLVLEADLEVITPKEKKILTGPVRQ
jgi:hypothetical protein